MYITKLVTSISNLGGFLKFIGTTSANGRETLEFSKIVFFLHNKGLVIM